MTSAPKFNSPWSTPPDYEPPDELDYEPSTATSIVFLVAAWVWTILALYGLADILSRLHEAISR